MDILGIIIGLVLLAIVAAVVWVAKHPPTHAAPAAKDLSDTIAAAASESWSALKADLPSIISAEVAQLQVDKAALIKRAEAAEASLAAEVQASAVRLEAVKAQVGSVIAGIASQPASTLVGPTVAATQAADAARVVAFADQISPAPPALQA